MHTHLSISLLLVMTFAPLCVGCRSQATPNDAAVIDSVADRFSAELSGELVEILLIGDKFTHVEENGKSYLYAVTIYILIHESDRSRIEATIEQSIARLRQDFTTYFLEASDAELRDPAFADVKQATMEICRKRFGTSSTGETYVREVIVANWTRFSSDL